MKNILPHSVLNLKDIGRNFCFKNLPFTFKVTLLLICCYITATNASFGLPSYARQTGMSCEACHNSFPELTSFGRQFKLNGYTLTGMSTIEDKGDSDEVRLKLLSTLPISAMAEASVTTLSKKIPGTQNSSVDFPQQLSVFYAGQITPHIGTFIQITLAGATGTFGMDNTDIRYANQTSIFSKSFQYGFTLNNNPSVQDIWNTLPAWGYRYASSGVAPKPTLGTLLETGFENKVAGLGGYFLFNNWIYAELSFYRTVLQGSSPLDSSYSIIKGVAPYWRVALQHQMSSDYISLGTFGLAGSTYPKGVYLDSSSSNRTTDIGVDLQYEHVFGFGTFTLHSAFINESHKFSTGSDTTKLNSFKIDANMFFKKRIGATVGYFSLKDKAAIAPSDGFIAQLDYLPWYNTKFSIQYVMYNKFDGQAKNYDGLGRNAADNNTLYLLVWLNF